jgi:hypothetical protein
MLRQLLLLHVLSTCQYGILSCSAFTSLAWTAGISRQYHNHYLHFHPKFLSFATSQAAPFRFRHASCSSEQVQQRQQSRYDNRNDILFSHGRDVKTATFHSRRKPYILSAIHTPLNMNCDKSSVVDNTIHCTTNNSSSSNNNNNNNSNSNESCIVHSSSSTTAEARAKDAPTTFVTSNGNTLQVTWETKIATEILQRATSHQQQLVNTINVNDISVATTPLQAHVQSRHIPFMVAIAGVPGSGKSSSAEIITQYINQAMSRNTTATATATATTAITSGRCVCIPADGYHYSLETLQSLQQRNNDTTMIYRRGAPDTFDVSALIHDLQHIRRNLYHYRDLITPSVIQRQINTSMIANIIPY